MLREQCPVFTDWPSAASLTRVAQPASGQPWRPVSGCLQPKAGRMCLPGRAWFREPAHPTDLKGSPSPVNGSMGGNTLRRVLGTFSSAIMCCCLLCHLPTSRSCAPGTVARGSKPFPPGEPHTSPEKMQIVLRRGLRLPLPLALGRCRSASEGRHADAFGDHALACPRTSLLARRTELVERVWCKVARETAGPEGHVVPQLPPTIQPVLRTAMRRKHATYPELAADGAQPCAYSVAKWVGGGMLAAGQTPCCPPRAQSPQAARAPAKAMLTKLACRRRAGLGPDTVWTTCPSPPWSRFLASKFFLEHVLSPTPHTPFPKSMSLSPLMPFSWPRHG